MNLNATDRGRVPQVGDLVGEKYRITAVLGQGGMGVVFRAVHQHTGREVALKTIKPALAQSLDFQNRFESEARAIGALRHPNIVDVTDFGYSGEGDNRFPYLVLELLEGYPVAQTLQSGPGLPWFWAIAILEQVCQAVAEAHGGGVVHGDLKPENVWLRPRATTGFDVKVVDFGLARFGQAPRSSPEPATAVAIEPVAEDASLPIEERATLVRPTSNAGAESSIAGTPAYMSPERWRGEPLSPATDIYSLGVMAYRMLTGRLPQSGAEPRANETPEHVARLRPDVPAHAAEAVMSALSPDAKKRPASARAFLDLLQRPAMDASPRRSLFPVHSFAVLTRALSRRPLQTAVVVLTLALGIGAATSVFSIMNGVLFQALPFKDPGALVRVYDTQPACATCPASVAKLDDWKRRNRVFAAIGGVTVTPRTLTGLGDARRIRVARTTASMADVLGVPPLIGRWFTEAEDQPGGPALVLLSFETWTTALNRDPGVVGRKLLLDGLPHEVVGVMPATFTLQRADVYVPLQEAVDPAKRGNHFIPAYARLKAGVGIEEATRDMRSLGETLAREFGPQPRDRRAVAAGINGGGGAPSASHSGRGRFFCCSPSPAPTREACCWLQGSPGCANSRSGWPWAPPARDRRSPRGGRGRDVLDCRGPRGGPVLAGNHSIPRPGREPASPRGVRADGYPGSRVLVPVDLACRDRMQRLARLGARASRSRRGHPRGRHTQRHSCREARGRRPGGGRGGARLRFNRGVVAAHEGPEPAPEP